MNSNNYSTLDDFSLVKKTREGDNEALKILSERHSGIYYDRISKVGWHLNNCERKDFEEDKEYFIFDAARKYDENRGMKFPSYLGQMTMWKIMSMKTAREKEPRQISLSLFRDHPEEENPRPFAHVGACSTEEYEASHISRLNFALNANDEKTNEIMRMRAAGISFEKIAAAMDCTKTWCRCLYNKGIENIRKKYKKERDE